jgi:hypothetical protein
LAGAATAEGRRAREGRRERAARGRKAWEEWWTAAADRERPGASRGGAAAAEGEGKEAMVGMARAEGEDRRAREEDDALYITILFNFF